MHRTIKLAALILATVLTPVCSAATAAEKSAPAKAGKADTVPAGAASIAYDDLREHIGERIAVQTRYRTTRVGTLSKFSKMELTLTIDTSSGPSDITIPKDNVVRVTPAAMPAPPKH